MTGSVVGYFSSADDAQRAVAELERAGFTKDDVSYVAREGTRIFQNPLSGKSGTESGAAKGAGAGLLIGLAAIAIPGVGPAVAAGPLAMALVGASAGGLLGALADLGVPKRHAKEWSDRLALGGSLVVVRVNTENVNRAEAIVRARAEEVRSHDQADTVDTTDPHADFPNYGSDGGSSQWGQRVLGVEGDESVVKERTITRDKGSKKFD